MKSTDHLPIDPLGTLGAPIKPKATPKPDPAREFERATDRKEIGDNAKAIQTIADALKPHITAGEPDEWAGLDWQSVTNF